MSAEGISLDILVTAKLVFKHCKKSKTSLKSFLVKLLKGWQELPGDNRGCAAVWKCALGWCPQKYISISFHLVTNLSNVID